MADKITSTKQAFILTRKNIAYVVNNAEAHNFKYAPIDQVMKEVKRAADKHDITWITDHIEHELYSRIIKFERKIWENKKVIGTEWIDKIEWVSKGVKIMRIFSLHDDIEIIVQGPANWSADKAEDATYGASTSGERYVLNRAFGIPTLDEEKARAEYKKLMEAKAKAEAGGVIEKPVAVAKPAEVKVEVKPEPEAPKAEVKPEPEKVAPIVQQVDTQSVMRANTIKDALTNMPKVKKMEAQLLVKSYLADKPFSVRSLAELEAEVAYEIIKKLKDMKDAQDELEEAYHE